MNKQMTKAQLVDENIALRASLNDRDTQIASLEAAHAEMVRQRNKLHAENAVRAQGREAHQTVCERVRAGSKAFTNYWDYVKAAKAEQRGNAVVTYMNRDQFFAARFPLN